MVVTSIYHYHFQFLNEEETGQVLRFERWRTREGKERSRRRGDERQEYNVDFLLDHSLVTLAYSTNDFY